LTPGHGRATSPETPPVTPASRTRHSPGLATLLLTCRRLSPAVTRLSVRLRALARAPAPGRGGDPGGQPAGGDQERGVRDHAVLRPDRQAFAVPVPHQRLP